MTTFLIGVLATVGAEAAALIIVLIVCACKVAGRGDHGTDGKRQGSGGKARGIAAMGKADDTKRACSIRTLLLP